jgi:hypothetical protein
MFQNKSYGRRVATLCALAAGFSGLYSCQSSPFSPAPEAKASPQRPSLSFDGSITPTGVFELETGLVLARKGSWSVPSAIKYGWNKDTELSVGWSPWIEVNQPGENPESTGDVVLAVRRVVDHEGSSDFLTSVLRPLAAVQLSVKLPTADDADGIGSGEVDWSLAGVATHPWGDRGLLAYGSLDSLGDPAGGTQFGFSAALAASSPIGGKNTGFVEFANVSVPDWGTEQYWATVGMSHPWSDQWIGDLGFSVGLNDEAPDWQILIGFTRTLGRTSAVRPMGRVSE